MLLKNSEKLERIATLSEQRRGLIDGFKIAIVGKPNVGKSSIFKLIFWLMSARLSATRLAQLEIG